MERLFFWNFGATRGCPTGKPKAHHGGTWEKFPGGQLVIRDWWAGLEQPFDYERQSGCPLEKVFHVGRLKWTTLPRVKPLPDGDNIRYRGLNAFFKKLFLFKEV